MKTHRRDLFAGMLISLFCSIRFVIAVPPVSDDFEDRNDQGWVHYDPLLGLNLGGLGAWSFPNGAYRLQATPALATASTGPARVGSYRTNDFAEFYVQMDLVNWAADVDELLGLLGRLREPAAGESDGYAFTYNTRFGRTGPGRLEILRIANEESDTLAELDITLTPGQVYRFVFTGSLDQLTGHLFDLTNSVTPVATLTASDATYTSGYAEFFCLRQQFHWRSRR